MKKLLFLILIGLLLFSCEKDDNTVMGTTGEQELNIDTLFTDWGTFDRYGYFWLEPQDSLSFSFTANNASYQVTMDEGIRLDLYEEIRLEYTAVTDSITVRSSLFFPNAGVYVAYEEIEPLMQKRVKFNCPDYKISDNRLGVRFTRIGTPTDGTIIVYDLLVTGVRKEGI